MTRPQDRELLMFWIREQKKFERLAEKATEDGKLWVRRAKLAASKGEDEMARAARAKAFEARDVWEKAKRRIETAKMEREVLQRTSKIESISNEAAERRAEHALEQFRQLGIGDVESEFAALERGMGAGPGSDASDTSGATSGSSVDASAPSRPPASSAPLSLPTDEELDALDDDEYDAALDRLRSAMRPSEPDPGDSSTSDPGAIDPEDDTDDRSDA